MLICICQNLFTSEERCKFPSTQEEEKPGTTLSIKFHMQSDVNVTSNLIGWVTCQCANVIGHLESIWTNHLVVWVTGFLLIISNFDWGRLNLLDCDSFCKLLFSLCHLPRCSCNRLSRTRWYIDDVVMLQTIERVFRWLLAVLFLGWKSMLSSFSWFHTL